MKLYLNPKQEAAVSGMIAEKAALDAKVRGYLQAIIDVANLDYPGAGRVGRDADGLFFEWPDPEPPHDPPDA